MRDLCLTRKSQPTPGDLPDSRLLRIHQATRILVSMADWISLEGVHGFEWRVCIIWIWIVTVKGWFWIWFGMQLWLDWFSRIWVVIVKDWSWIWFGINDMASDFMRRERKGEKRIWICIVVYFWSTEERQLWSLDTGRKRHRIGLRKLLIYD